MEKGLVKNVRVRVAALLGNVVRVQLLREEKTSVILFAEIVTGRDELLDPG